MLNFFIHKYINIVFYINIFFNNVYQLENAPPDLLKNIPEDVREHEKMLINPDPAIRPDADQMVKVIFFNPAVV